MSKEIDLDSLFDDEFEEEDKKKEPSKEEKKAPTKKKTVKKVTTKKKTKKQLAKEKVDKEKAEAKSKEEETPQASEESTEPIPDDFDDLFDEPAKEEKKDEGANVKPKVIKGKVTGDYKDTTGCAKCEKIKNNVSGQTGYCFECDEETDAKAKGKVAADQTVKPTKAESEAEADSSEESEASEEAPELPAKQSTPNRARVAKFKAPTEAEIDALSSSDDPQYDDSEMGALEDRTIFAIVGDKGSGKTTLAFSGNKDELPDEDPRKINPFSKERQPTVICCIGLDKQGVKNAKKFRLALWKEFPEKAKLVKART